VNGVSFKKKCIAGPLVKNLFKISYKITNGTDNP
jgi:hypothetical protein